MRYLHAWTLGACVIGHTNASLAMPEIKHRENALLGNNAKEIAALVAEASENFELRRSLGTNGYETYKRAFTGTIVASRIASKIQLFVDTHAHI